MTTVYAQRNFFGVKRVVDDRDGRFRTFVHGTTNHGMQWRDPARAAEPTAYYHRAGPIGDVFRSLDERDGLRSGAVVGLGAGGLAAYAGEARRMTFFEIDPAVQRIAETYFTYLERCGAACDVVLGDGRLKLADRPGGSFDLIVLDAFSSDAVPTHLLTREALAIYLSKLAPDGLLVFNITNAYLELQPVMATLADSAGLIALHRVDDRLSDADRRDGRMATHYVALARRSLGLGSLLLDERWSLLEPAPDAPLWTDQYCDILGLLRPPRRPTLDPEAPGL